VAEQIIVLDAGDALVGDGKLGDVTRGKAIIDAMNLMGYDAMALGPKELSLGLDVLRLRMDEADFPALSANVVLTGTQQLVAKPYVILEKAGRRLGVIGLTRPPLVPIPGLQVLDAQVAAAHYVSEVAARSDTVIVLTNLEEGAAQTLAQAVPGIDLVIAALPPRFPTTATRSPVTRTLVAVAEQSTPNHAGRAVGSLTVILQADGSLTGESWRVTWLDKRIADDPAMAALLARYK